MIYLKKELIKVNIQTLYKFLLATGFKEEDVVKILEDEEALNDSYLELFELIGRDAMLKLFKYFRGDKIDCPMRLYHPEFIEQVFECRHII